MNLDRSHNYKKQVENLVLKLRSRTNLIMKLAGTNWGAKADILKTSKLALLYNKMNYSSPIWFNSVHSNKVNVQLNISLRIISGTLKATSIPWLYVFCNISPGDLLRKRTFLNCVNKSLNLNKSILYEVMTENVPDRLVSRKPIQKTF